MALTTAPILDFPDHTCNFYVDTNPSAFAIGTVWVQCDTDGTCRPVQFFSKKLDSAQHNYSATDSKLNAVIQACTCWHCYLANSLENVVYTDHEPLKTLYSQKELNKRQTRWLEKLQELMPLIQYREGPSIVVPDALSHRPDHGSLSTIVVELSFLAQCLYCMFGLLGGEVVDASSVDRDIVDDDMLQILAHAQSRDSEFHVEFRHGYPLVFRANHDGVSQLIAPEGGGLRQLLLEELHSASLGGHFGVHHLLALLQQRVWWPCQRTSPMDFVHGCLVYQQTKDSMRVVGGLLQPLPIPSRRFKSFQQDFITELLASAGFN